MPEYIWSCLACRAKNFPDHEHCAVCNCPAYATSRQIQSHRTFPDAIIESSTAIKRPIGVWLFIALFVFNGLSSLWVAISLFGNEAQFDEIEFVLMLIDAGASFIIFWLLYRLSRSVIQAAWVYFVFATCNLIAPFLFDSGFRNLFVGEDSWLYIAAIFFTFFIFSSVWIVFLFYLYRLNRQGKLH